MCELILLSVSLTHRYTLQYSWNHPTLTITLYPEVMFCLYELCLSHTKKNVLSKFLGNRLYGSQQARLQPSWLCWMGAVQQSMYCIPIFNLDDFKDRVRTCWENLDQQTDRHIYRPMVWWIEGCDSTEWTHWTAVLTIWYICRYALFCYLAYMF